MTTILQLEDHPTQLDSTCHRFQYIPQAEEKCYLSSIVMHHRKRVMKTNMLFGKIYDVRTPLFDVTTLVNLHMVW